MQVIDYSVRPTLKSEHNLPYITSSMVEAINTCPKWGIIHSHQRKRFVTGFRQMALEAGSLMHEVFSVFNLWQLAVNQNLPDHAMFNGIQLFGKDRWNALDFTTIVEKSKSGNQQVMLDKLAFAVIGTSDYYDDPGDRSRTLANLEHCASELSFYFLMNHTAFTIYVECVDDPTSKVGVEQSLDVIFEPVYEDGSSASIRFIGLADTVYQNPVTRLVTLGEYKTTSQMNDAWREAFRTRHQISAYNGALEAYYENTSFNTILTGSAIPVRKTTVSVQHFTVDRDREFVKHFLAAAAHALEVRNRYPESSAIFAPMFTHSCNRYFRPCSLLDLCSAEIDDQAIMWEQMEITDELSPSEMKAFLRQEN